MKKLLLLSLLISSGAAYAQIPIDFDKIENWSGNGDNRAALAITFGTDSTKDPTWVWGYKFNTGLDENGRITYPTGEDMFKTICANNNNLVLLTQYTGQYGATVCGIGIGSAGEIMDNIYFDFEMAKDYEWISFDYYSTNIMFGQKEAPGDNTPTLCLNAIEAAKSSHYIQHPIDAKNYGYPAYDYDCWKSRKSNDETYMWHSGWYEGYWSYWTAAKDDEEWTYSGTGFTGRQIRDGYIDGWTYTVFDTPGVGGFGEGTEPAANADMLYYVPANASTGIELNMQASEQLDSPAVWYNLSGLKVAEGENPSLPSGIYIVRSPKSVKKTIL